jgi:hypothetical protein
MNAPPNEFIVVDETAIAVAGMAVFVVATIGATNVEFRDELIVDTVAAEMLAWLTMRLGSTRWPWEGWKGRNENASRPTSARGRVLKASGSQGSSARASFTTPLPDPHPAK